MGCVALDAHHTHHSITTVAPGCKSSEVRHLTLSLWCRIPLVQGFRSPSMRRRVAGRWKGGEELSARSRLYISKTFAFCTERKVLKSYWTKAQLKRHGVQYACGTHPSFSLYLFLSWVFQVMTNEWQGASSYQWHSALYIYGDIPRLSYERDLRFTWGPAINLVSNTDRTWFKKNYNYLNMIWFTRSVVIVKYFLCVRQKLIWIIFLHNELFWFIANVN